MALLGMLGSGSFVADERPKNWLQGINYVFPNGDAPLTAILSMLPEKRVNDPEFNWFDKGLPAKEDRVYGAAATIDAAAGADVTSGTIADNADVFLQVGDASKFEPGDIVQNVTTEELYLVKVVGVGAGSDELVVTRDYGARFATNPAITGVAAGADPADHLLIVGSGSPEGAGAKASHLNQPSRYFNYTQIFRNSYELSRTSLRTALRTDPNGPMTEAQRDAFAQHSVDIERAFLLGERAENTALLGSTAYTGNLTGLVSTARPLRTMRGFVNWLPTVSTSATTPAVNWDIGTANSGNITEDIIDAWCEELFRYGSSEKLVLCGGTFLNAFNKLAKTRFTINAVPTDQTYGLALQRYTTNFGELYLKQHPLMSHHPVLRRDAYAIDMAFIEMVVLEDTEHRENIQAVDADAVKAEFLSELSLRMFFTGQAGATAGGLPAGTSYPAHGRLRGVTGFAG